MQSTSGKHSSMFYCIFSFLGPVVTFLLWLINELMTFKNGTIFLWARVSLHEPLSLCYNVCLILFNPVVKQRTIKERVKFVEERWDVVSTCVFSVQRRQVWIAVVIWWCAAPLWDRTLRGGFVYVPDGFMESNRSFHFLVWVDVQGIRRGKNVGRDKSSYQTHRGRTKAPKITCWLCSDFPFYFSFTLHFSFSW